MTQQEILDAFGDLYVRARQITKMEREWIAEERQRLQAECRAFGHVFGIDRHGLWTDGARNCQICGIFEKVDDL